MAEQSELLEATDETIDETVKYADPMVLRGLLFQLTGDESIATTEVVRRNSLRSKLP
jgi:4-hydroxyacetophenone monooxygenase